MEGCYLWRHDKSNNMNSALSKRLKLSCASSSLTKNAPSRSPWMHREYSDITVDHDVQTDISVFTCHFVDFQLSFHTLYNACGVTVWKHMVVRALMVSTIFI